MASTLTDSVPEFDDEQLAVRDLARRFATGEVAPRAAGWDADHVFPSEQIQALGALGLMGATLPTDHGGGGVDYLTHALLVEELARADAGFAVTVVVHTAVSRLITEHASAEQVERWLPGLATGACLGAFALTEAHAGSDVKAIRTRHVDGRLTGTKQWCTNGSHAGVYVVYAKEPDDRISAFLVEAGAPGLTITGEADKMGQRSSSTADLALDGVPAQRMGAEGGGVPMALEALGGGRISIAALATGLAQAALDLAIRYATEREAFGRPIGAFQAIAHKLAEMDTSVAAARALTHAAARRKAAGLPHVVEASRAKLFASRAAREVTGEAVQVLGGYGYVRDFPAERYYRDAKITEIYEGTSEIQRLVIGRSLLGDLDA